MKILLIIDILLIAYRLVKSRYLKKADFATQLKYAMSRESFIDGLLGLITVILIIITLIVFVIEMV